MLISYIRTAPALRLNRTDRVQFLRTSGAKPMRETYVWINKPLCVSVSLDRTCMHTAAVLFYCFGFTRLQVSIWNLTTMVHAFPCSWFDLCCPWFTFSSHWRCCKHTRLVRVSYGYINITSYVLKVRIIEGIFLLEVWISSYYRE